MEDTGFCSGFFLLCKFQFFYNTDFGSVTSLFQLRTKKRGKDTNLQHKNSNFNNLTNYKTNCVKCNISIKDFTYQ